ncbi:hypothetical protein [Pseudomonas sp. PS01297]|uniref:hypothetical protein n=1 Tax=Pseudomonas sp. PS01297 TaxID=2991433 RepID=UPI00249B8F4B|nr:hypothetical protein [Pseudomonas sp. PS01297]
MLDDAKTGSGCVQNGGFEWHSLTNVEQGLIRLYRQLCEEDRKQLRRVTETLATNPEEQAVTR